MWLLGLTLVTGMVLASSGQEDVTVTVDLDTRAQQISDKFLGLSVSSRALISNGNYSTTTVNMLKGLSPIYLRVETQGVDKEILTSTETTYDKNVYEWQWAGINQLASDTGMSLIIGLDREEIHRPDNIFSLMKFMDQRGYNPIWQLQYDFTGYNETNSPLGADLGKDLTSLRKMLDKIPRYQESLVLGPEFIGCEKINCLYLLRDFLKEAGDKISAITLQSDPINMSQGAANNVFKHLAKLRYNVKRVDLFMQVQVEQIRKLSENKLWLVDFKHKEDMLMWALKLGLAARLGYQTILQRPAQLFHPTPEYWVSLLYRSLVGDKMLNSQSLSKESSVTAFAHCAATLPAKHRPGAVVVWGVNIGEDKVGLSLHQNTPHHVYILTLAEKQNTLLNGRLLDIVDEALPKLSPHILQMNTIMPISIPSQSIFFIVLPDIKANACLTYPAEAIDKELLNSQRKEIHLQTDATSTSTKSTNGNSEFYMKLNKEISNWEKRGKPEQVIVSDNSEMENEENMRNQIQATMEEREQAIINNEGKIDKSKGSVREIFEDSMSGNTQFAMFFLNSALSPILNTSYEMKKKELFLLLDLISKYEDIEDKFKNMNSSSTQNTIKYIYSPGSISGKEIMDSFKNRLKISKDSSQEIQNESNHNRISSLQKRINWFQRFRSTLPKYNKTTDSDNIHYLPGEFYKSLGKLAFNSSDSMQIVEDPNEAVVLSAGKSSNCTKSDSTLKVTRKKENDEQVDSDIIEKATEQIKQYYDTVNTITQHLIDNNKNLSEKMECCSEKEILISRKSPSRIKYKRETELYDETESKFHKYLFHASNSLPVNVGHEHNNSEKPSNRMKREIIDSEMKQSKTKKDNVTEGEDLLRSPDSSEKSRVSAYLEELTDEGEQLLKAFDNDYKGRLHVPFVGTENIGERKNSNVLDENVTLKKYPQEYLNTIQPMKLFNTKNIDLPVSLDIEKNADVILPDNTFKQSGDKVQSEIIDPEMKQSETKKDNVTEGEDLLRSPDFSEESRVSAYLEELTDEGEQLLKAFDNDYKERLHVPFVGTENIGERKNSNVLDENVTLKKYPQKHLNTIPPMKLFNTENIDLPVSLDIEKNADVILPDITFKQSGEKVQSEIKQLNISSSVSTDPDTTNISHQNPKRVDGLHYTSATYVSPTESVSYQEKENSHQNSVLSKEIHKFNEGKDNGTSRIVSENITLEKPLTETNSTQLSKFISEYKIQSNSFVPQLKFTKQSIMSTFPVPLVPNLTADFRQATYSGATNNKFDTLGRKSKPANLISQQIRQDMLSARRRERLERVKASLEEARQRLSTLLNSKIKLEPTKLVTKREVPLRQQLLNHIDYVNTENEMIQKTEENNLIPLKNNNLVKFLEDKIVKVPRIHEHSLKHRLTRQKPMVGNALELHPLLGNINHRTRSRRSTKNAIERNEVEMKAHLTNEIIKRHPSNSTYDPDPNEGAFRSMLHKTLKAVKNKTGIERMLEFAKQYNKTNPDSIEIFRSHDTTKNINLNSDRSENENKALEAKDMEDDANVKQVQSLNSDGQGIIPISNILSTSLNSLHNESENQINHLFSSESNILSVFMDMIQELVKTVTNVNKNV